MVVQYIYYAQGLCIVVQYTCESMSGLEESFMHLMATTFSFHSPLCTSPQAPFPTRARTHTRSLVYHRIHPFPCTLSLIRMAVCVCVCVCASCVAPMTSPKVISQVGMAKDSQCSISESLRTCSCVPQDVTLCVYVVYR